MGDFALMPNEQQLLRKMVHYSKWPHYSKEPYAGTDRYWLTITTKRLILSNTQDHIFPLQRIEDVAVRPWVLTKASLLSGVQQIPVGTELVIYTAEQTITAHFTNADKRDAQEIAQTLQNAIANLSLGGSSAALSSADELKKYKELLDCGVITQTEFDAKKKQLLGL